MTDKRNIRVIWFVPTYLQFYQDSFKTDERTHGQSAMVKLT